ncbi:MAG: DUF2269 family protein [Candidatus Limnocylindria bacterium]
MDLYDVLKFVHILLVTIAVGFNASYGIWLARASSQDGAAHLSHVLRGIKFLDDRFANPAYALLLATGLAMVFVGSIPLTTFWILTALALYVAVIVVGLGFYTPLLRRQLAVLEASGADSAEYGAVSARARVVGIVTGALVLIIVFLMVVKPTL